MQNKAAQQGSAKLHKQAIMQAELAPQQMRSIYGNRSVIEIDGVAPAATPLQPCPGLTLGEIGDLRSQPQINGNGKQWLRPIVADTGVEAQGGGDGAGNQYAKAKTPLGGWAKHPELLRGFGKYASKQPAGKADQPCQA